jgi:nitrite reductase (NADH) small subunit
MTMAAVRVWVDVCAFEDLVADRGVAAMVGPWQVAVWRLSGTDELFALENWDPFCQAFVLSRGLIGSRRGVPKVASPMFKHNFDLRSGECLDDPSVRVATFEVRRNDGRVEVTLPT